MKKAIMSEDPDAQLKAMAKFNNLLSKCMNTIHIFNLQFVINVSNVMPKLII